MGAGLAACVALALLTVAPPAHALRIVTWNLLQYPLTVLSARQPNFRTVMAAINADVVITQELDTAAGRDSFLTNVLNVVQPGEWTATSWLSLNGGEGGAVFYKPARVTVTGLSTIATSGPRLVLQVLLKPVGYTSNAAATRLYSIHLKAGTPSPTCSPMPCTPDSTRRRQECTDLRNALNLVPAGTNLLLGGDSNFYGTFEGGFSRLTENQLDNDGRLFDPLAAYGVVGTWNNNSAYAVFDTQCPCNVGCINGAFSGGGMDDRFDIWLTSNSMKDGEGLDYIEDTTPTNGAMPYTFGNDGTKFNNDINSGGSNGVVPIAVANALHDASDHLPVVITLQVPAKVVVPPSLAFGQVLVGASVSSNLSVSNGATAPADELDYSLTPPADFTAPGGGFQADAGAGANLHAIGMSTASVGAKAGTLNVNSDDVDIPVAGVALSGTVLDHAASSLDSTTTLLATSLDFGDHQVGEFANHPVRVHSPGYDALHARLSVNAANIVGGDGRFSIDGGFSPALIGGTGQSYSIHFNDVGATLDQVYTATLTFSSGDEALPGAAAASDLVVNLRAKPLSGAADVPGPELPTTLAFYPPHPNPVAGDVRFAFDLPVDAPVSLAVFDLTGRRVASIASGTLPAGRYQMAWNAISEAGSRVAGGLYFARFHAPGMNRVARLIVLP